MPTVLRQNGFRFFFYSNEHLPEHIHFEGKGGEGKIELNSLILVYSFNLKKKDLKLILNIVEEQRFFFLKRWNEFYER
ncbi:DUF4160 domain-containing protein [Autumnicola tepida]|uniref:DUF4160 domain-containing protein n=1 Tax=Autumnicola tepida TaxID=3075595 RepID=UPI003D783082